jgi:hypothetical protein
MATSESERAAALHRAGSLADAEAGYRACLRGGQPRAGIALAALLLQTRRFEEACEPLAVPLVDALPRNAEAAVNHPVALP